MCVKLNSLFASEMKVYYVTHTPARCVLTAYLNFETPTRMHCKSI